MEELIALPSEESQLINVEGKSRMRWSEAHSIHPKCLKLQ